MRSASRYLLKHDERHIVEAAHHNLAKPIPRLLIPEFTDYSGHPPGRSRGNEAQPVRRTIGRRRRFPAEESLHVVGVGNQSA